MPPTNRKRRTPVPEPKRPAHRPPRMAEIRRKRQRILLTCYLVLSLEIVGALLTSPLFAIKRTRIQGTQALPPQEAAAVESVVTIQPGANWFCTPTGGLEKQLASLPWVKTAQVSRRFPDTVQTQILLREPIAIVETHTNAFEVDKQGFVIRIARTEVSARLPHVVLEGSQVVQTGSVSASDSVRTAIQIFQSVGEDPVVRIAKILVDQNDNLCLNMRNGIRIQFGSSEAIETKLKLARRTLEKEPDIAARVAEINLSCPEAPACTPRVAEAPPTGGGANTAPNASSSPGAPEQGSQGTRISDHTML